MSNASKKNSIDFLRIPYRLFHETSEQTLGQHRSNDLLVWENRSVPIEQLLSLLYRKGCKGVQMRNRSFLLVLASITKNIGFIKIAGSFLLRYCALTLPYEGELLAPYVEKQKGDTPRGIAFDSIQYRGSVRLKLHQPIREWLQKLELQQVGRE